MIKTSTTAPTTSTTKKRQLEHDRVVASTYGLRTNKVFVYFGGLLLFSLFVSVFLGMYLLYRHNETIEHEIQVQPIVITSSASSTSKDHDHHDQKIETEENIHALLVDTFKQQQQQKNGVKKSMDSIIQKEKNEPIKPVDMVDMIPYNPPFSTILDGEQLAQDVLDGTKPTIGGIVHILQMFLKDLRSSNKLLQNVSNDKDGEDTIRLAYFRLAQKHLVPLDEPYRNRTIFPVRTEEESIFISLAAYREHLLYDTLAGAFEQATHPEHIYVGIVMQNCFGYDDETLDIYKCYTGVQVVGKRKDGSPLTKVSETSPDVDGLLKFCSNRTFTKYCEAGHIRVLHVHESESLGPAIARYYASKLWGGETYFLQVDAHLQFTSMWDVHYINEMKATKNYPKSILSMYPPGFDHKAGDTPGTRLCTCEFSPSDVEDHILRINNGESYLPTVVYERPYQIAFIAAGFFFTRAEFLRDVPFDPFLPWCFMGEEIALSMRAWTSGWAIYAPRKNWIAHQYRPGRLGLPKFWETVGRVFHRGIGISNRLQTQVVHRIKFLVGYPEITIESLKDNGIEDVLQESEYYSLGTERTREEYLNFTQIDVVNKVCRPMKWCNKRELE